MVRPLLVIVLLLTFTATAHAECAWVIWRNSLSLSRDTGDHWFPEQAVDSHRECEGIVNFKNAAEERLRNDPKAKRVMEYSWLCLPDTVKQPESRMGTWVLWTQMQEPGLRGWWNGATWTPHSSYETKERCEDPLSIRGKTNDPLGIRQGTTNTTWRCLPDTVDPRGPKGK